MIESVATGLFIASVTGLTVLAYKQPDVYARLFKLFQLILLFVLAWLIGRDFGGSAAFRLLAPFVERTKFDAAVAAFKHVDIDWWWPVGLLGLIAYLAFLSILPQLLEPKDPKK